MSRTQQGSNKALIYAIAYVGICTIFLYSMFPSDLFAFEGLYDSLFYLILSLCAFPGQLFSWGIRFGGLESNVNEFLLVLVSQIINVLIWWKLFNMLIEKKVKVSR